jgi:hypothetical protein
VLEKPQVLKLALALELVLESGSILKYSELDLLLNLLTIHLQ